MQRWKTSAAAVTIGLGALGLAAPAQAAPGDKIPNRYICVFKDGAVSQGNVRAKANRAAAQAGGQADRFYAHSIRGFASSMSATAAANLTQRNPNIAYCEQDQEVAAIQSALEFRVLGKPAGGGGTQPVERRDWGVERVNGGGTGYGEASFTIGRTAWVIDTGIDLDHPDLKVDTARSRNFVARETSPDDLNGHGSHVAGTIGAVDNEIGAVGVSPGVNLVAVRVLDRRGSGSNSGVIAGVDYVGQTGLAGDVANMSLGGGVSTALDAAVVGASNQKGVKFVLAAGNESDNANNHSPARANGANIFTVSSFAKGDIWSSFSNFGNPPIDYAGPGSSIYSTYKDGGYATISGTSMATPHIAGIMVGTAVRSDGTVGGDPDGNPDIIGVR
jgi:subtilisin family serine protease